MNTNCCKGDKKETGNWCTETMTTESRPLIFQPTETDKTRFYVSRSQHCHAIMTVSPIRNIGIVKMSILLPMPNIIIGKFIFHKKVAKYLHHTQIFQRLATTHFENHKMPIRSIIILLWTIPCMIILAFYASLLEQYAHVQMLWI